MLEFNSLSGDRSFVQISVNDGTIGNEIDSLRNDTQGMNDSDGRDIKVQVVNQGKDRGERSITFSRR